MLHGFCTRKCVKYQPDNHNKYDTAFTIGTFIFWSALRLHVKHGIIVLKSRLDAIETRMRDAKSKQKYTAHVTHVGTVTFR